MQDTIQKHSCCLFHASNCIFSHDLAHFRHFKRPVVTPSLLMPAMCAICASAASSRRRTQQRQMPSRSQTGNVAQTSRWIPWISSTVFKTLQKTSCPATSGSSSHSKLRSQNLGWSLYEVKPSILCHTHGLLTMRWPCCVSQSSSASNPIYNYAHIKMHVNIQKDQKQTSVKKWVRS